MLSIVQYTSAGVGLLRQPGGVQPTGSVGRNSGLGMLQSSAWEAPRIPVICISVGHLAHETCPSMG